MALELIILAPSQLGYLKDVIAAMEIASTLKAAKKGRNQIFSALYAIKPERLRHYKADDLSGVYKKYDPRTHDITYEFWYQKAGVENEQS